MLVCVLACLHVCVCADSWHACVCWHACMLVCVLACRHACVCVSAVLHFIPAASASWLLYPAGFVSVELSDELLVPGQTQRGGPCTYLN